MIRLQELDSLVTDLGYPDLPATFLLESTGLKLVATSRIRILEEGQRAVSS